MALILECLLLIVYFIITLRLLGLFEPTPPTRGVPFGPPLQFLNIDCRVVYLICLCRYFNSVSKYVIKILILIGQILLSWQPFIWIRVWYNWGILKCIQKYYVLYKRVLNKFDYNYMTPKCSMAYHKACVKRWPP